MSTNRRYTHNPYKQVAVATASSSSPIPTATAMTKKNASPSTTQTATLRSSLISPNRPAPVARRRVPTFCLEDRDTKQQQQQVQQVSNAITTTTTTNDYADGRAASPSNQQQQQQLQRRGSRRRCSNANNSFMQHSIEASTGQLVTELFAATSDVWWMSTETGYIEMYESDDDCTTDHSSDTSSLADEDELLLQQQQQQQQQQPANHQLQQQIEEEQQQQQLQQQSGVNARPPIETQLQQLYEQHYDVATTTEVAAVEVEQQHHQEQSPDSPFVPAVLGPVVTRYDNNSNIKKQQNKNTNNNHHHINQANDFSGSVIDAHQMQPQKLYDEQQPAAVAQHQTAAAAVAAAAAEEALLLSKAQALRSDCYRFSLHRVLVGEGLIDVPFPSSAIFAQVVARNAFPQQLVRRRSGMWQRAPAFVSAAQQSQVGPTTTLFFGCLPRFVPEPQLDAMVSIFCNVKPLCCNVVANETGRGAGCAHVVVRSCDADKVIASLHKRVLFDEACWIYAQDERAVHVMHHYCGMLAANNDIRYQSRPYEPVIVVRADERLQSQHHQHQQQVLHSRHERHELVRVAHEHGSNSASAASAASSSVSSTATVVDNYHPICPECAAYRDAHTDASYLHTYLARFAPLVTLADMMPVHSLPPARSNPASRWWREVSVTHREECNRKAATAWSGLVEQLALLQQSQQLVAPRCRTHVAAVATTATSAAAAASTSA